MCDWQIFRYVPQLQTAVTNFYQGFDSTEVEDADELNAILQAEIEVDPDSDIDSFDEYDYDSDPGSPGN